MKKYFSFLLIIFILMSCGNPKGVTTSRSKWAAKSGAPSGKFRNPTMFSRANPFQGRAKMQLAKSKRKRTKLFKRKRKQGGTYRRARKPGRTFSMKRTVSRGRLKSSGSRSKGRGGSGRKNKDLFNTRKK